MSVICSLLAACKAHEVIPKYTLNDVIQNALSQKATQEELLNLLPHKMEVETSECTDKAKGGIL